MDAAVDAATRRAALVDAARALDDAADVGATLLLRGDALYPAALLDLSDPPPHLFALGDPRVADAPAVAIVGTRRATAYGERTAHEIATALARAGVAVISGLARGIDAVAHRAALDAGGRTVAVLGTGVDVAYPAAHAALHARIAGQGLVLSEHAPGERAGAGAFPRRNRIIAALASTTIVIEAGFKSGALITASHALDLGRTVAAVPGPIDAPQSAGANELLRDGAAVIASPADALALLGVSAPRAQRVPLADRPPDERAVLEALTSGALDIDSLAARARLPAVRCLAAVTALELSGAVDCALTGEIRRL
ncbi:MAG TPA: DNA-processing protein DprA [Gemmatimonadaceae bacterium]|nr:DNA-processing protein DprA [Gemmatimonadaceae bacterium]